ncbi:MAG: 6-phosphogluconate dehydrogenase (decarboxylating), partial [Chloroflexi bacterium]
MQLGMVGLGRMGANIVRRLMRGGHDCVVWTRNATTVAQLAGEGATGASDLDDFVAKLAPPRAAWVMVPAAATQDMIDALAARMSPGDIIIDGGNSYYHDDIRRGKELAGKGM